MFPLGAYSTDSPSRGTEIASKGVTTLWSIGSLRASARGGLEFAKRALRMCADGECGGPARRA